MLLHVHGTKNGAKDDQVNPLQRSHAEIHPFAALHTADLARKLAASVFIMDGGVSQPKPKPFKDSYASFLKDFVDPVHSGPHSTSVHSFVSEWLESIGTDREKRCRSDSHLHYSNGELISRHLTRSEPSMGYTKDADGFTLPLPPTLASIGSRSTEHGQMILLSPPAFAILPTAETT